MPLRSGAVRHLFAVFAALACSADPHPAPSSPRQSLLEASESARAFTTPATWRYHPKNAAPLRARRALDDQRTLYAGDRGERWLVNRATRTATPAARLAPESLRAIVQPSKDQWVFVGVSGTAYEAREPLGNFVRSSAPLDALVEVAAAGQVIVGLRTDGTMMRTDDAGASWRAAGPDGAVLVDVEVMDDGSGLALAVPEQLFQTRDHGASWTRIAESTFGATRLDRDESGALVVGAALGAQLWVPGGGFSQLTRPVRAPSYELGIAAPIGPDAGALVEGRAFVHEGRYYEARASGTGRWSLVSGDVLGSLTPSPLRAADKCHDVRVAGYKQVVYLACVRQEGKGRTQGIELYRSEDGGKAFTGEPYMLHGRLGDLLIAPGDAGALLVSGVCPAQDSGPGCRPQGLQHRQLGEADAGRRPEVAPSAAPALVGAALGIAFAADGKRAFAVGRRSKGGGLAVFVSRDGGASFEAHEIEPLSVPEPDQSSMSAVARTEARDVEAIVPGPDGSVAVVIRRQGESVLLVTDDEAHVIALSSPPVTGARIAASGTRALAVALRSGEVWESLDAGSSWEPVGRLPVRVCAENPDCNEPLYCHAGGCVVGGVLSRRGWQGQEDDLTVLSPPSGTKGRFQNPKVKTPFVCSLDGDAWHPLPSGAILPGADQAAIGDVAWFTAQHEPAEASVAVLHARGGAKPKVERTALLEPSPRANQMAYDYSMQVEGIAALRYPVPEAGGPRGSHIGQVEVAWDNRFEGRIRRVVLPDGGVYRPGDFEPTKAAAQQAQPALVSIGEGGLYLRLHSSLGDSQPTYFLDGRSVTTIDPVEWPFGARASGRSEMAHVDAAHVPLRIDAATVVRARRDGSAWAFDAMAIGWSEPRQFGLEQHLDIAYLAGRSGLHVTVASDSGRRAAGWLYPFQAKGSVMGTPVAVPTQLDLPDQPRRCSGYQKNETPRVVVPFQPGTRHPVLVADPIEPVRLLLTGDAVLHGTPSAPCVAAFDADIVPSEASEKAEEERALILLDDLEHSWLLRRAPESNEKKPVIEYRTMSCRLDPSAEVPLEVYGPKVKGTVVY